MLKKKERDITAEALALLAEESGELSEDSEHDGRELRRIARQRSENTGNELVLFDEEDLVAMGAATTPTPDDPILKEEELQIIRDRLHLLSSDQCRIIRCMLDGLDDSQTMAAVDLSRNRYRAQKSRALSRLREMVQRPYTVH